MRVCFGSFLFPFFHFPSFSPTSLPLPPLSLPLPPSLPPSPTSLPPAEDALDRLLELSPFDVKHLLHLIFSRKEFSVDESTYVFGTIVPSSNALVF